ncbi:MAG: hypothetical protein ACYC4L_01515 [Chloroflexota bacterium]
MLVLIVLGVGAGVLLRPGEAALAGGPGLTASAVGATRTSEGGSVTLKVTWQTREPDLTFTVAMDTHSVQLDGYDLRDLAVLRTNDGREVKPLSWQAPGGGHHRQGTLTFPTTTADGTAVLGDGTKSVRLIIRGVAGVVERELSWEV